MLSQLKTGQINTELCLISGKDFNRVITAQAQVMPQARLARYRINGYSSLVRNELSHFFCPWQQLSLVGLAGRFLRVDSIKNKRVENRDHNREPDRHE